MGSKSRAYNVTNFPNVCVCVCLFIVWELFKVEAPMWHVPSVGVAKQRKRDVQYALEYNK